jgi:uncharacterized protein YecE (DUF72 family)
VWERFLTALDPLRAERKLGAILLQFPPWFPISRARKDYIVACAERAAPDRVCVEFRNRTWMTPGNQEETLGFLAQHRLPYVGVDMPQGHRDSIPPVLAATAPDLVVVRMRGHSGKWDSKDIHERFSYGYTDAELTEWAPRVRALGRRRREDPRAVQQLLVRREALLSPMEVRYRHRLAVAAAGWSWRQPEPWIGGEGGSSLDKVAPAGHCRTGRAR